MLLGDTNNRHCGSAGGQPALCPLCDVRERSICSVLGSREMVQVEKVMARRTVPKNRAVLIEGEPNDNLYVVIRGSFRLSKYLDQGRRQITGFLFKGDLFGMRATKACAYTAEALEESLVCRFPHRYLEDIAKTEPTLKDSLVAHSECEYHKAQDHIVLLGKKDARERVLSFLEMIDRSGRGASINGYRRLELPMSRQDIADYLGLRLETLSRTLSALKQNGHIKSMTRREIVVHDALPASEPSSG